MLKDLQEQLEEQKIDALLVTDASNVFYLSGFRASHVYLLITKNHAYLFTDGRYLEKASKQVGEDWRVVDLAEGLLTAVHTTLMKHRATILGIEPHSMKVDLFEKLQSINGIQLILTKQLVEQLRLIKTQNELRALRQSQRVNEQVLKLLLQEVKVGVTEAELAWRLHHIAHDLGATAVSFDPIIAFGAHGAMPHHESSHKKKLKRGDMILIDMGVFYQDMASDMTRTFFTKTPTKQQEHIYETVLQANLNAIKAAKPGVACDDVDRAARRLISHAGYSKKFCHSTGHGIGLDVHELPHVSKGSDMVLQPGMVITIEPGVYLASKAGVRIEDMIEITEKGNTVLTNFVKQLSEAIIRI